MLTSRDVSFIMVTGTRQGLWVKHIPARGGRQLWKISVCLTFLRTMTRYSIPQGGKTQSYREGREEEEAFLPLQKRLWQPERNHKLEKEKMRNVRWKENATQKSQAVKLAADRLLFVWSFLLGETGIGPGGFFSQHKVGFKKCQRAGSSYWPVSW